MCRSPHRKIKTQTEKNFNAFFQKILNKSDFFVFPAVRELLGLIYVYKLLILPVFCGILYSEVDENDIQAEFTDFVFFKEACR